MPTLAAASRVTSARSEKTVTFRMVEVSPTVLGSSGTGAARLAGTEGEGRSWVPDASAGLPAGTHAAVATSAVNGIHAHCPIVRLVCVIIVVLPVGDEGPDRGARPRAGGPDGRARRSIYPARRFEGLFSPTLALGAARLYLLGP